MTMACPRGGARSVGGGARPVRNAGAGRGALGSRPRFLPVVAAMSALVLLGSGCVTGAGQPLPAGSRHSPGSPILAHPGITGAAVSSAPSTLRDCGPAADFGGPDGGVVAGLVWLRGDRPLRTPVQAYLCIGGFTGSVVSVLQSGNPVAMRPARFTVPDGGGVLPVTITATAPGTTILRLQIVNPAGKPQVLRTVARAVAGGDRWHLEQAD